MGRGQRVVRGYARGQAARGRAGRAPGTRPDHIQAGRAGQILAEGSRVASDARAPAATEVRSATSSGPWGPGVLSVVGLPGLWPPVQAHERRVSGATAHACKNHPRNARPVNRGSLGKSLATPCQRPSGG
jgi:hypothetical protein